MSDLIAIDRRIEELTEMISLSQTMQRLLSQSEAAKRASISDLQDSLAKTTEAREECEAEITDLQEKLGDLQHENGPEWDRMTKANDNDPT